MSTSEPEQRIFSLLQFKLKFIDGSLFLPCKFQIQQEIVANASAIWPIHFSAMFEAYRVDGPPLAQNDVVLAINSGGIFLLDSKYDVMVGFHYYDLMEAVAFR